MTALLQNMSGLGMIVTASLLSWQDLQTRRVSAIALLSFTVFTFMNVALSASFLLREHLIGALATGFFMVTVSLLARGVSGREMIGGGDVWFAFSAGLAVEGVVSAFNMLTTAFLLAAVPAVFEVLHRFFENKKKGGLRAERAETTCYFRDVARVEIPFIPFLAIALLLAQAKG